MSTIHTDDELLAVLRRDVEAGAALLMEVYHGMVWRVCARRLQNPEDIRECVNSAFADFCIAHERYDPRKGSLQNYLCTIADRRALERYRKIRAANRVEAQYSTLAGGTQPLGLSGSIAPEDLRDALDRLSSADAQLLRMRYYSGMSFTEIAKALDLPYETVKKRGQRSLKKLKSAIL